MKLIDYMRSRCLDDETMAKLVGLSPSGLRKIKYGERSPSLKVANAIGIATRGAVGAPDLEPKIKNSPMKAVA